MSLFNNAMQLYGWTKMFGFNLDLKQIGQTYMKSYQEHTELGESVGSSAWNALLETAQEIASNASQATEEAEPGVSETTQQAAATVEHPENGMTAAYADAGAQYDAEVKDAMAPAAEQPQAPVLTQAEKNYQNRTAGLDAELGDTVDSFQFT